MGEKIMRFASTSTELKISQWPDGKEIHAYKPKILLDDPPINSISWGKNGAWLLLTPSLGAPEIVALNSATSATKVLHTIRKVTNATCSVFQSTTKRNIAVGTSIGEVLLYDVKQKYIKCHFTTRQEPIFKLQFTSDDKHLLSACKDGCLYVNRLNSGNQIGVINVPKSRTLTNFRCHPNKTNLIGVCSEEGVVAVWDHNIEKAKTCYEAHNLPVSDLVLDSNFVLSIGLDCKFCMFDERSHKIAISLQLDGVPSAMDLSPDASAAVIGFSNGVLQMLELRNAKLAQLLPTQHSTNINQVAFERVVDDSSSLMDMAPENSTTKSKSHNKIDSFLSQMDCDTEPSLETVCNQKKTTRMTRADSFLNALHLNETDSTIPEMDSDCNQTDEVLKTKTPTIQVHVNKTKLGQVKTPIGGSKRLESVAEITNRGDDVDRRPLTPWNCEKKSSTPLQPGAHRFSDHPPASSPIFAMQEAKVECTHRCLTAAEIKTIFKDVVREEIEPKLEEIKQESINHRYDLMQNVAHGTFSLHSKIYDVCENLENAFRTLADLIQHHGSDD